MSRDAVVIQGILEGYFTGKAVPLSTLREFLNLAPVKGNEDHLFIEVAGVHLGAEASRHLRPDKDKLDG